MDLDAATALHVFDMDGTLLVGTTASREIASIHDSEPQLLILERRLAAGEIDTRTFAAAIHHLWHDLRPETVAAAFAASPWMTNVAEVCKDIRARGEASVVITMSPDFFAGHLTTWGFNTVVASVFPALPFVDTIDPARILTPEHKVLIVDDLLQRHALPRSRCVAYGDSMSDAPLFRHLTATIAVNADQHLAGLAAGEYQGEDLFEAYRLGRAHLDRPPVAEPRDGHRRPADDG